MSFKSWDKTEMQRYAAEAKRRWGATDAYQEYERRAADQPTDQAEQDGAGLMALFAEFGALRDASPAGPEAQALTARLQQYITDHYYTCTKQILQCLGQMYTAGGQHDPEYQCGRRPRYRRVCSTGHPIFLFPVLRETFRAEARALSSVFL